MNILHHNLESMSVLDFKVTTRFSFTIPSDAAARAVKAQKSSFDGQQSIFIKIYFLCSPMLASPDTSACSIGNNAKTVSCDSFSIGSTEDDRFKVKAVLVL